MLGQTTQDSETSLGRFILPALFICIIGKLYFGSVLDLYSDEVFYWLASTKPAIAYSDLPFVTALLAGLGSSLSPGSSLALRSMFIVLGSLTPLLVFWVALPLTNKQKAIESALFSLCLPLGGFLGLLAVPDVPLLFFGLLAIGSFERSLRTDSTAMWILTGLFVALGFSTHYRFILYPVSAVLFLSLCQSQRRQWQNKKLWLAFAIASMGLAPIIWFNLQHDLSSASFYFVDRHPWQFQTNGLLHVFKQAGLVTPPLYALLIYTLVYLFKQTRCGDTKASFLFYFSATHLLAYMILAPWSDANSTSIHWPLSGYFPLLVVLPDTLRQVANYAGEKWHSSARSVVIKGVPLIGFLGTVTAFIGIGSQAFQDSLQTILGQDILSNKMAGWAEFNLALEKRLAQYDAIPVLVTDNYYTAAQIEFAGLSHNTFTIDEKKAVSDGRITQLHLWQKDVVGLSLVPSSAFLFLTEDSTLNIEEKTAVIARMCALSSTLSWDSTFRFFAGDKKFSVYTGTLIGKDNGNTAAGECPYPTRAWLDAPQPNSKFSGTIEVSGWAFKQDIGIAGIRILVDGESAQSIRYELNRPDVAEIYSAQTQSDPNSPMLGFSSVLETEDLAEGWHEIELEIVGNNGETSHYGKRLVELAP
ncbi:MAG: hypothetical protein ACI95C_000051 [Pseudohongiellaceae bacterium]